MTNTQTAREPKGSFFIQNENLKTTLKNELKSKDVPPNKRDVFLYIKLSCYSYFRTLEMAFRFCILHLLGINADDGFIFTVNPTGINIIGLD